ncbi:MAG TPA: penicillin acylase family protein, partial [Pyrinomonadaceae bacterium]|nr:penicillin acylase family protein [Pyrinomonadaceae bacterium]
ALPVARTLHGPVVTEPIPVPGGAVVLAQKRAHWQREMESVHGFLGFDRARDLKQFAEAVELIPTSHNFIYADQKGNIAYWQAGDVPLRPAGFDPRLPFPGDGSAEWPGALLPIPTSINPAQGYLANWNNKPEVGYDNADSQILGKQNRLSDIDDRLASGPISLDDMRDIPKDIARVKGLGREARFLKPHLLAALDAVPPAHPLAAQARAVVEAWDGNAFADAVTSTTLNAGEVIFATWLSRTIQNTFADELGAQLGEASTNALLHSIDFALTGQSGVPPSRDYFNGASAHAVMSNSFDQVVAAIAAAQGANPAAWTAPRGSIVFAHPIVGVVGSVPNSNRATYAQIVVLDKHGISGENIFTLGQSGFIQFVPPGGFALDPHFRDLLPLYRNFQYKPMRLYKDDRLKQ